MEMNIVGIVDRATQHFVYVATGKVPHLPKFPSRVEVIVGLVQFPENFDASKCCMYRYEKTTRTAVLEELQGDILSELSRFNRKYKIFSMLSITIAQARKAVQNSMFGQADIYEKKALQAQQFIEGGFRNANKYPYIVQQAEVAGTTAKAAAIDIQRKHRQSESVKLSTERCRLLYQRSIFRAQTDDQLDQLEATISNLSFN